MNHKLSFSEAVQHVVSTNPTFEVTEADVRGTTYQVFKNIPPHSRALLEASYSSHDDGRADYLVYEGERWTYSQFVHEVSRLARALETEYSVTKGTRVAIAMRNLPEYPILIMAISSLGAVVVFLNGWWTTEELDYALRDSDASLVFADSDRIDRLEPLRSELGLTLVLVRNDTSTTYMTYSSLIEQSGQCGLSEVPIAADDDFAIMYSSGTTGHPKGVVQTHRGAMNAVFTWLMQAAMAPLISPPTTNAPPAPRPSALIVTPLFHVTATHPLFLLSLPAGAKIVLIPKWDAEEAVRLLDREKITRFMGVPTQSADLIDASKKLGVKLDSLEFIGSGGAKRPSTQVGELAQAFPGADIATGWGMTETNAVGIGVTGTEYVERPASAGRLQPPLQELRFLDDDGLDVPAGDVGEITVKSPCNMRCYLNKPDATSEVLQDGWLRTGDLGFIDEDGFVTIVDRKKNIVIRGGENISCLDVEGALHRHPAIAEACAFSVPHERLGETVGASIQVRAGQAVSEKDVLEFLRDHIAQFKIPEHIWIQHTPLPRGPTDKIDRRGLRSRCLNTLGPENAPV